MEGLKDGEYSSKGLKDLQNLENQGVKKFLRVAQKKGTVAGLEFLKKEIRERPPDTKSKYEYLSMKSMDDGNKHNADEFHLNDRDEPDELNFFDKEEIESRKKKRKRCLINPNGWFKKIFDHIILLCVFYVATFSAFKLGFVRVADSPLWLPTEYFVDFCFTLDIVLTFFTPKVVDSTLIENHLTLAKNYLKLWFWLDLIAVLPF